jgi:DnaJ family protein C protein 2
LFGKTESDLGDVIKFYEFWFGFKSWRDFKVEDEYELDEATNAFEKREMMKENKRLKKQKVKEENARIQKMVNFA